jgi:ABC-2 type transport system permease protein
MQDVEQAARKNTFDPEYVQSGQFGRLLGRPRGLLLQLFGHELRLSRLGRMAHGAVVFAWALTQLELAWTAAAVPSLLFAFTGALAMFCGVLFRAS